MVTSGAGVRPGIRGGWTPGLLYAGTGTANGSFALGSAQAPPRWHPARFGFGHGVSGPLLTLNHGEVKQ
jgi:hypothetical protein